VGAGVHRRVHLGVGRLDPAGGPARLGSGVPDRPGPDIGYAPVANRGVPALEPDRLAHVSGTYLSAETFSLANAPLIDAQAGISFARVLGGGLVAAIDGMRFVVPVPSVYARPNRKYFGPKRGVTWLNMINDQAAGLGGKVVAGTVRDSLHMIDVLFNQDGGQRPDIVVSDTASYSDLVFGLVTLLGVQYRPALADLPDQKGWRVSASAGYGPLNAFARGRIDLGRIRAHWHDVLRVVVSIYTGEVRAYDVVRMLQRAGHPTALGEAIASYGRIPKTLHICTLAAEEPYRRDIKGMRNLQEGRHALAAKIFHGKKGELCQRYHEGMEDQLGALGLILNCVVLWNTRYISAALDALRAQDYPVLDEDVARLSHRSSGSTSTWSASTTSCSPTWRGRHPPAARPRRRRRRAARLSHGVGVVAGARSDRGRLRRGRLQWPPAAGIMRGHGRDRTHR
jgi:TnpA family transposase